MAKQRTEKGQAALVFDTELNKIEYSLRCAAQMTGEQLSDYFGELDPVNNETARLKVLCEYHQNELKSNIILDYISQALDIVRSIQKEYAPESEAEQ